MTKTTKIFANEIKPIAAKQLTPSYLKKMAEIYFGNKSIDFFKKIFESVSVVDKDYQGRYVHKTQTKEFVSLVKESLIQGDYSNTFESDDLRIAYFTQGDKITGIQVSQLLPQEESKDPLINYRPFSALATFNVPSRMSGKMLGELVINICNARKTLYDIRDNILPLNRERRKRIIEFSRKILNKLLDENFKSKNYKIYEDEDELAVYFNETECGMYNLSFNIPIFGDEKEIEKIIKTAKKEYTQLASFKTLRHPAMGFFIQGAKNFMEKEK